MKPAVKSYGYKYYEYVTIWVDDCITISDNPSSIIRGLQYTYVLHTIKILLDKYDIYLGALVRAYNMSKCVGVKEEEIYPYISSEAYIGKLITVVEGFYDLSKYSYNVHLPR